MGGRKPCRKEMCKLPSGALASRAIEMGLSPWRIGITHCLCLSDRNRVLGMKKKCCFILVQWYWVVYSLCSSWCMLWSPAVPCSDFQLRYSYRHSPRTSRSDNMNSVWEGQVKVSKLGEGFQLFMMHSLSVKRHALVSSWQWKTEILNEWLSAFTVWCLEDIS